MNLEKYQQFVEGLASSKSTKDFDSRIATVGLGLGGEGGEIADYIKKVLFHEKDFDPEVLKKELGDVMWYVAFACNTLGCTIGDIIEGNIEKLKDRYPTGKFRREDFLRKEGELPSIDKEFDPDG